MILPRIGRVRLHENPTDRVAGGKLLNATVVQEADRWFVSLCAVADAPEVQPKQRPDQRVIDVIGADIGVAPENYLVCSDGKVITAPLPLRKEMAAVRWRSRSVSRKRDARAGIEGHRTLRRQNQRARDAGRPSHYPSKAERRERAQEIEERRRRQLAAAQATARERGDRWVPRRWEDLKSGRQRDAEMTLARTHARVKNRRSNATHEATTRLVTKHDVVVIEKLHVKGMMAFGHLGRSIADVCPGEFRRQTVYKGAWRGTTVILAPVNFPSTQKCSRCGYVRRGDEKLSLRERTYACPRCGLSIGRDLNSARNLEHYGRREMASRRGEAVSRAVGRWWDGA